LGPGVPAPGDAIFFQAPLGDSNSINYRVLNNLLNAHGYFVMFSSDADQKPAFLTANYTPKYRFRLMEYGQPSEENRIYNDPLNPTAWIGGSLTEVLNNSRVIADNILAIFVSPMTSTEGVDAQRYAIAPNYSYDSRGLNPRTRYQLPPLVRITMVAMDEASADLLELGSGTSISEFIPTNLFRNAANYETDIIALKELLSTNQVQINYRVFSGIVSIRGSKWSDESLITVPGGA
ncbi:MAG: hypothetical protein ACC661_12080, partial [Verrucomicrobiales bacterium]